MQTKLKMAIDNWFCSVKSHKSSRKPSNGHQQVATRHSEPSQQSESNTPNQHRNHHISPANTGQSSGNNLSYRYVTINFHAEQEDEITVLAGEYVLYESSDLSTGKKWSHVWSVSRNERGFVPDEILSTERPVTQCTKKKIPRSNADPSIDHTLDVAHPHRTPRTSYRTCHSNGDSIKLQPPHHLRTEQPPPFDMHPNSLQGSSGCQTVQKYPDWSYSGYYNLNMREQPYEMFNCRPFHCMNHDLFYVLHNFVAREEGDLMVAPGDLVTALNKDDPDWFYVRRMYDNATGFVPSQFICHYEQVRSVLDKGNSTVTMKSSNQNDFHTYINHAPDRESLPNTDPSSLQQI